MVAGGGGELLDATGDPLPNEQRKLIQLGSLAEGSTARVSCGRDHEWQLMGRLAEGAQLEVCSSAEGNLLPNFLTGGYCSRDRTVHGGT